MVLVVVSVMNGSQDNHYLIYIEIEVMNTALCVIPIILSNIWRFEFLTSYDVAWLLGDARLFEGENFLSEKM